MSVRRIIKVVRRKPDCFSCFVSYLCIVKETLKAKGYETDEIFMCDNHVDGYVHRDGTEHHGKGSVDGQGAGRERAIRHRAYL